MPNELKDDALWLCVRDTDPAYIHAGGTLKPAGFDMADVRRLYMRLWLRHAHKGHPAPEVPWTAEDDAALRACAAVVKEAPRHDD